MMATKVDDKTKTAPKFETPEGGEIAVFERPRLAWHPAIEERFADIGVNKGTWKALIDAVFPLAMSVDSIVMALSYCKARRLDPFKRVVHIVPMWNGELKRMVDTVWPGIAELRTTASRTGEYVGKSEPAFGPMVTRTIGSREVTYPEWCKITVFRWKHGAARSFTGQVWWEEAAVTTKDGSPNSMWSRRIRGQLAKVAEAEALREAFPEEIGGEYTAEEMQGQMLHVGDDGVFQPGEAPPPRPTRDSYRETVETAKDTAPFTIWGADGAALHENMNVGNFASTLAMIVANAETEDDVHGLAANNAEDVARALPLLEPSSRDAFDRCFEERLDALARRDMPDSEKPRERADVAGGSPSPNDDAAGAQDGPGPGASGVPEALPPLPVGAQAKEIAAWLDTARRNAKVWSAEDISAFRRKFERKLEELEKNPTHGKAVAALDRALEDRLASV